MTNPQNSTLRVKLRAKYVGLDKKELTPAMKGKVGKAYKET